MNILTLLKVILETSEQTLIAIFAIHHLQFTD